MNTLTFPLIALGALVELLFLELTSTQAGKFAVIGGVILAAGAATERVLEWLLVSAATGLFHVAGAAVTRAIAG